MISKFAEEIYAKSIQLKKYNSRNLLFKKNRFNANDNPYKYSSDLGTDIKVEVQ